MSITFRRIVKQIRGKVKQSDFIFSLRRSFVDKDLQREKRYLKSCTIKTKSQIKSELAQYKAYWHCQPDDYIRYGLFNKRLSIEDILDYIPMHYFYCDFEKYAFGDIQNREMHENKWHQYLTFKDKGINVPEVIAITHNNRLQSVAGEPMHLHDLLSTTEEGERLFFKPVDGRCGVGIESLKKFNGVWRNADKEIVDLKDLNLSNNYDYIVQRGLKQCKNLNDINASSLNTLRTIVSYQSGKAEILAIILRIGRQSSVVDNSGQGGISIKVDVETGKFSEYAKREHGGGQFKRHPDSGYVFNNNGIENWSFVKQRIQDIISRIDGFRFLGWDIAIGEDDVYAIEYNLGFGIEHAQTVCGGFRRLLNIQK